MRTGRKAIGRIGPGRGGSGRRALSPTDCRARELARLVPRLSAVRRLAVLLRLLRLFGRDAALGCLLRLRLARRSYLALGRRFARRRVRAWIFTLRGGPPRLRLRRARGRRRLALDGPVSY